MKKLIFIALFAFVACQPQKDPIVIDPEVEKRAIANIEFGMNKAQYDSLAKEYYDVAGLRFYAFPKFTSEGILYEVETGTMPLKLNNSREYIQNSEKIFGILLDEYGTGSEELEGLDYSRKWTYGSKKVYYGSKINLEEYSFFIKFLNDSIKNAQYEKSREKIKEQIQESKGVF